MKQPRTATTSGDSSIPKTSAYSRIATVSQTPHEQPSDIDLPVVWVGGVRIHSLTEAQCADHIFRQLDAGCGGWVVTVNLDYLRLFSHEPKYAALCAQANLTVADGTPLVWASYLQGTPLPERVTGSNLMWSLTAAAASNGRAIFLLGGSAGTAQAAAAVLRQRHPTLRVAGAVCPVMGFESDPRETARITRLVTTAAPDVVYVGLGKPKQDLLIQQLRSKLPKAWFLGVGISFSFVCGAVPRAPLWMQRFGLEWLHRLAQEPRQLATRYLIHGLPLAARLLGGAAIQRLRWHRPARKE